MGKPRDLANVVATGNIHADGAVAPAEWTGVNATAAELNILDGVTATAAELNLMDGVTATTAELNHVDGVTSNVQTQMDTKAPVADPTFTGTATAPTVNASTALQIGGVAVTATAAELNKMDGVTVSASDINSVTTKAPIDGATFTGTTTIPTADINGGAIDGAVIGANSAVAGTFTDVNATGTATIATADINGGAIDGATIGANSAAAVTATTVNASTKLQVNSTDVITNARALNNITSIDSTTASAITAAGVGGSDPITYHTLTSDALSTSSARHHIRTNYIYIQQGSKIYTWHRANKTAGSVTTITGLTHMMFISDTLAVGCSNNGMFKITINGDTITAGTQTNFPSITNYYAAHSQSKVVGLSSTQAAILTSYRDGDSYYYWAFAAVDISGSAPSIGTMTLVYASGRYQSTTWFGSRVRNGNQFIATGRHAHSTGANFGGIFHVSGTTINYTQFTGQTGSQKGPGGTDFGLPFPYNEGDALSWLPNPSATGYYVGPHNTGYPNLATIGFANTTSATTANSYAMLSPSGAPQTNRNNLERITPITTTTNNGQYYVLQYTAYAVTGRNIYRALYRVQSNSLSVDNNNIFSSSNFTTDTNSSLYDIPSTNTYLNFYDDRSASTDAMNPRVRLFTINTSNHTHTSSLKQTLPTSGSTRSTMSTIPTMPLLKNNYLYNFEQDFYAKSNDYYNTQNPGRISAYIPYSTAESYGIESVRVIEANLAIVFDSNGTKMVEVTE